MQTPVHIHPDVLSDELQSRRVTLETHVPQIAEVLCFNQCPNACLFSEHLCISCCQLTAKNYQIDFSFMFRPPTCIRNCKPLAARLVVFPERLPGDRGAAFDRSLIVATQLRHFVAAGAQIADVRAVYELTVDSL